MNVVHVLNRARRLAPGRVAIDLGGTVWNYEEFHARVVKAANALRALGVRKGDRVAVLALNSHRYLELYFATAWMGALIVPLNTRWNTTDVDFSLADSGSTLLAVDHRFASWRTQLRWTGKFLYTGEGPAPAGMAGYEESLAAAPADESWASEPDENDLVGLFYTSGTTGGPKGVMLTHRNIFSNLLVSVIALGVDSDWMWLHSAPMFHLANGAVMYALVACGARYCFLPGFEPEAFLRAVQERRVTAGLLLPTMMNMLLNHPELDSYDISSMNTVVYGASPMPLELLRRAREKFSCRFVQGYGMTESSPLLTVLAPEDHCFEEADQRFAAVKSAGKPVIGVDVRVVDPQDRELPPGEAGEIVARGPNVMKGYWNRPEISAEVLRGGWLHTGDIGLFDERGFLHVLDRKKDMIKTGGENVYSPEVESVICSHPDVLEVAVIGMPDERWGETIKAVVVRRQERDLTEQQVIAFCRERMTHFKCPTSVDFLDALPKGGTGKIQKHVLRERYAMRTQAG